VETLAGFASARSHFPHITRTERATSHLFAKGNMVSVVERCCRTCANAAPDHYRAALRCVPLDVPVSASDACLLWRLNHDVVGGQTDRRYVVVVSTGTLRTHLP
jgi:hypothetical protein